MSADTSHGLTECFDVVLVSGELLRRSKVERRTGGLCLWAETGN